MTLAATHPEETARLAALHAYGILDTPPEADFDAIARIAAYVCNAPIAVINFVDSNRQWFKSTVGLGDIRETPLDISICSHAILQPGLFIVPDTTQDTRFADNPMVTTGPCMRFYAGALLETNQGFPLGTLCVLDRTPRHLTREQGELLEALAKQVMLLLQLYRYNHQQAALLTEVDAARREMALLASTDALTGLSNRRAFSERLTQEVARLSRSADQKSCLLLADLDHFKKLNDRYGHQTGDVALKRFATSCTEVFRSADVLARWGGEEFVMLLPDTLVADACQVADRLHSALAHTPITDNGESFHLSVSIGIVELDGSQDMDVLLHAADTALYAAKNAGRACSRTA